LIILWRGAEHIVSPTGELTGRDAVRHVDAQKADLFVGRTPQFDAGSTPKSDGLWPALDRYKNIFLHCEEIGLGKRSGCLSVCHLMARDGSRIKRFAPLATLRFSLYVLGASQRKRLDRPLVLLPQ
jgi:hypothetical protein